MPPNKVVTTVYKLLQTLNALHVQLAQLVINYNVHNVELDGVSIAMGNASIVMIIFQNVKNARKHQAEGKKIIFNIYKNIL